MKTKDQVISFILTLTSKQCAIMLFISFCIVALVSFISLSLDFSHHLPIIITPIVVSIYSWLLYLVQKKGNRSLPVVMKDSPYILGFLCTIWAILITFYYYTKADSGQLDLIFENTGVALLGTIAGVLGRYFLICFDPIQNTEETYFNDIVTTLKESTKKILESQKNYMTIIDGLCGEHKTLFDAETQTFTSFVTDVSNTIERIKQYEISCSNNIGNFFNQIDLICTQLSTISNEKLISFQNNVSVNINELQLKIDQILKSLEDTIAKSNLYCKMFNDSADKISTTIEKTNANVQFIDTFHKNTISELEKYKEEINQINKIIEMFIGIAKSRLL
jgi:hypothetical protein